MVYWVVFDMDSTLGWFTSVSNYLICFAPWIVNEIYEKPHWDGPVYPAINLPHDLYPKLQKAFKEFVRNSAKDETHNKLLRPGILQIIKILLDAKAKGGVGGMMIYSNNSSSLTVLFCHELIKAMLGIEDDIFNPCLCWLDEIRKKELTGYKLCHGPKTIETIKKAFRLHYNGINVKNEEILFFDDAIHTDIESKIPKEHYFNVHPYEHYCDIRRVHISFLTACLSQPLPENRIYIATLKKLGYDFLDADSGLKSMTANQATGYEKPIRDELQLRQRLVRLLEKKGGRKKNILL